MKGVSRESVADFESSRAVIVGINAYSNGVPALRSAVNDARDLAKILSADHGYSVTRLLDGEATLDGLERHFGQILPQQVGDKDRVLVYFAGHGIAEEGDDGPTGYLLPQDARPDDRASFLPMETFRGWLGKLRCRHLLVILDCCFAGAFRWTKETRHIRAPLEVIHRERYERFIRHPARLAIASAAYDQEALDTIAGKVLGRRRPAPDNTPNSPFARALFEALKGDADLVPKNGDGVIMAYELATFLREYVSCCADDAKHEQAPCLWSLGKEDGGEFIFLVPGHPLNLSPAPELKEENNPYRGLSTYEEKHAGLFFGRDKVVQDLATVVARQPLTMVLGASGTGKSSLLRAGLLAYPRKIAAASGVANAEVATDAVLFGKDAAAAGVFHRLLMRPADAPAAPLRELVTRLSKAAAEAPSVSPSESVTDETLMAALSAFSDWFAADPKRHLLLVIDQFEELITLCSKSVGETFLHFLADLLDRERERLRIVLTLRSDFEPQFTDSALQRHLQAGVRTSEARFLVPPLQHHELREIIEKPASERVLFFEPPALVDWLITEVIQMPGALPLLSFALSELYLAYVNRQQAAQEHGEIIERAITEEDYRQLGGVVGALSQRASEEYDAYDDMHRRMLRRVMLRMVATEGELARRRVPRDELIYPDPQETERARNVIERLRNARLLVSGRGAEAGNDDFVEPAHDALVRAWGKLLDWQREAAAELPVQRQLTEAAAEWARRHRATGLLWTADPRLPLVRQHLAANDGWLNRRETDFVQASVRRKRRNAIARWSITAAVLAGLIAFSAGIWQQWDAAVMARDQAQRNHSQMLATLTENETASGSPAVAVRVALSALPRTLAQPDTPYVSEVSVALYYALERSRELRRFIGHEGSIIRSHLSPDGAKLVTSSQDRTARVWEVATGRELVVFRGHRHWVDSAQFSPDGTRIITTAGDIFTASGEPPKIWDAATGRELLTLGEEASSAPPAFSPDGAKIVTGSLEGKTARLWDAATGKQLAILEGHEDMIIFVAFSPDGRKVITGSMDNTARLWDAATGKQLAVLEGHEDDVLFAAFSPDGTKVVTTAFNLFGQSADRTARLWDATTGRQIGVLEGHAEGVTVAAFSPDSRMLITGSRDHTARLWDASTAKELVALRGHTGMVMATSFSPDGSKALTASEDGTAREWSTRGDELLILRGHGAGVTRAFFSPDGKLVITSSLDGTARVWDVREIGPSQLVLDFSPMSFVPVARVSPDEKRVLTLHVGYVQLWFGEDQPVFYSHGHFINDASFSRDGARIVTASMDRTARVWDIASGKELLVLRGHEDKVRSAFFSPEGSKVLTASADRTARLWDAESGREIVAFHGHQDALNHAEFSPDGSRMVTASDDGTARLWDTASGEEIGVLGGHPHKVGSGTFSPDGMKVLTTTSEEFGRQCDGCAAYLWDAATGRQLVVLKGHRNSVISGGFSSDGSKIVTTSADHTVRLWDATSGSPLAVLRGHDGPVNSAAFYSRDKRILTGSADGTVRAWPILPTGQKLIDLACARVPWPLTEDQRRRFGISEEWCTPEVSAELRMKLGLDNSKASASAAVR